jgi:uncharacterized protein (TIGR03437 family)
MPKDLIAGVIVRELMMKRFVLVLFVTALITSAAELDTGGNGFLRGDYFVRQVIASDVNGAIDIGQIRTVYGTMTFDGNGSYQFRGSIVDSRAGGGQAQALNLSGRYKVGANGLAEIEALVGQARATIFGAVGESAVVGSMTESDPQLHDLFVAIPAGAGVTNAALQGRYLGGTIDVLGGQSRTLRNSLLSFTSDGRGALSGVTVIGTARNLGTTQVTQTVEGSTYNLTGTGSGTMTLPIPGGTGAADQRLIGGEKVMYASADGELLLGGSANGHDLIIAFKAPTTGSNSLYNGTYINASLLTDPGPDALMWSTYGSSRTNGGNTGVSHDRTNERGFPSYDVTYSYGVDIPSTAISEREGTHFAISNQGRHLVWAGKGSQFSLIFETRARNFTGSGVFLHPLGITNAASFVPFTASVAPGEFVTIFGSGLADATAVAQSLPFPNTLSGVQVLVNGQPISLYAVSPTQISGILPYSLQVNDYAAFSVVNNGRTSNTITQYTAETAPGVFTIPSTGIGVPAALHQDFSVVTRSSPARVGETVAVFVTGLGAVAPAVPTGAAAPSDPLSRISAGFINVRVGGVDANVQYAGLAPGLAGLYQINFTVPAGVERGDAELYIDVPGSITTQTAIPVQ